MVHGHWYYYRAGNVVQYFFYKNIACFTAQLYFAFFNSFSTTTLFDGMSLSMYNLIYTSIPVLVFGLFEKNYDDNVLVNKPELYKKIHKNALLSPKVSLMWLFDAVWSSMVTFFAFYLLFVNHSSETLNSNLGMLSFGFAIYQSVVVVVSFRILAHSRFWNILLLLTIFFSLIMLLCLNLISHSFILNGHNSMYQIIFHVLGSPNVWLTTLLCTVLGLLPYMLTQYVSNCVQSSLWLGKKHNPVAMNGGTNKEATSIEVLEMVDDSNRGYGISIIGSVASQKKLSTGHSNMTNTACDNMSLDRTDVHNPEYAYINDGYVANETENTRM